MCRVGEAHAINRHLKTMSRSALRLRLRRSQREAVLNSDPSGLGGYIVLLDGRTMLRNQYATLSNQQRKPSFKFGTSDEFSSVLQCQSPSCLNTSTLCSRQIKVFPHYRALRP